MWSWVQVPLKTLVTVAQLAERMAFNHVVVGSSPTRDTWFRGVIWLALWTLNPTIRVQIPAKPHPL